MDNNQKRLDYIDILKGIAILSVVIGHMGMSAIDKAIYSFHMPLFFLISGYFLTAEKNFRDYAKDKIRQLIKPYIFTCIALLILSVLSNLVLGKNEKIVGDLLKWIYAALYGSCNDYQYPYYIKGIGIIWFLPALVWGLIIVKWFMNKKYGKICIFLLACIAYVSSKYIWLPWSIQAGAVAAVYIYIGVLLRKNNFFEKPLNRILLIISVFVWIAEIMLNISMDMAKNHFDGIFSIAGAVIICYSILCIAKKINITFPLLKRIFCFYGKNSLIIICFHTIETWMFPWSIVYSLFSLFEINGIGADIGILLGKIVFITVCTFITLRIPLLRKIF